MKNNASLAYSLVLVVGDFLALLAAFVLAFLIRGHLSNTPVAHPIAGSTYLGIFLFLLPLWLIIFALLGLYTNTIHERRFPEAARLLMGSFIGLLFVGSYAYASNRVVFPAKLVPVYSFILAFVFLVVYRNLARFVRSYLFRYDVGITNLLIVGNTAVGQQIVDVLADRHKSGYRIVGVVSHKTDMAKHYPHIPVFARFEDAVKKLKLSDIDGIVQTELYAEGALNNDILEFAQTNHISYRFVPGNSELFVGNIDVELFKASIPVIAVHQTALVGWGRIVKRVFDLAFSFAFLVIASPLMLVIIVLQMLTGGEVFFRQKRLTRFNNTFLVYKFRTHRPAYNGLSPEQAFAKMGKPELIKRYRADGDQLLDDPRVGKWGKFLRRTSLDELPQLINVFKGDLSLVGPRALVPEELSEYEKRHTILSVKSGVTGLAQVSGRRNISFEERRKLDLFYVQNWSLWLDLIILIKTVRAVLRSSGAR